jgi:hypothetical protein
LTFPLYWSLNLSLSYHVPPSFCVTCCSRLDLGLCLCLLFKLIWGWEHSRCKQ